MIRRLRWKFVLINMVLVTAILAGICTLLVVTLRDNLEQDSYSVLSRVIDETETPSWNQSAGGVSLPYFTVSVLPNGGAYITSSQFYNLDDRERIQQAINAAFEQDAPSGLLEEQGLRYLRQATMMGWRLAFVDVSYEQSTLRSTAITIYGVGLGSLALFFLISMLLARWAVRPVERAMQQQRRFVADASHELKTPLTVILSNADLLSQQREADEEQSARWVENIRSGGMQMTALVEQMLQLARSDDESRQKQSLQSVDLSELAQSAVLMFEPVAFEAGRTLVGDPIAPELKVKGESEKLKQLLDILLDNAVKYSHPGGTIRLSLQKQGRHALLTVTDPGDPIPEGELEEIFVRFHRGDPARSTEGFGLGLSIARTIVSEHDGQIWAESDPEGVNSFYCTLPLSTR